MTARLFLSLAVLVIAPRAAAQWTPTAGPVGSTFHHLAAIDAGAVFGASSSGSLFRLDGAGWTRTTIGPVRGMLASGSEVFVAGYDALHRSTDGGETFQVMPPPPENAEILSMDNGRLFAGRFDTLFATEDGGSTWDRYFDTAWVTITLPGQPPASFSVTLGGYRGAVVEGDAVFVAATAYIFGDVYRLAPGDSVWTPVVFRATATTGARFVTDLVRFGGRLFVASDAGVHVSDDAGATWEDASAGLAPAHLSFGGDLLAGAGGLFGHFGPAFYRLDGDVWTLLEHPPGSTFTLSDAAGDRLYAALSDGALALGAGGWEQLPPAVASTPILMHADGQTVLAAAGGRLHRTDDAGATWSALPLQGLSGFAHAGPSAMLAAVNTPSGIARSVDGGQTWTPAARPATPGSAGAIIPRRFAAAGASSYVSYAHQRFGDHGEPLGQYGGVFGTADGGQLWTDVSAGLPAAPLGPYPINVLFSAGASLIAQAGNGACFRRDAGPWQAIACPGGTIESFAAHAGQWYAISPTGVFLSVDHGATWAPASAGVELPADPNQHGLFWRTADLVATPSELLLVTHDAGDSRAYRFAGAWQPLGLEFPAGFSWTGFASGSDALFGGARDGGVWSVPLEVVTAPAPPAGPSTAFALGGPVPNPTSGIVHLELSLRAADVVTVGVFDALGRQVAILHDGVVSAGRHDLRFDTAALPAGMYLVRALADSRVASRTLTVRR